MCVCPIVLSSVACLTVLYFPTLYHKEHIFRETFIEKNVLGFCLQGLSETFLTLREIQRDIVIKVKTSLCSLAVILVIF